MNLGRVVHKVRPNRETLRVKMKSQMAPEHPKVAKMYLNAYQLNPHSPV